MPETLDLLVVDDDPGMAETLGDILEATGYRVRLASSGREALAALSCRPADVVFLDIKMPEMDGVQVLRHIKELCPAALTVMMTAYAVPDLIAQAEREGAMAILGKPLPVDEVLAFLSRLSRSQPVLIVEDDLGFQVSVRDILEAHGCTVTVAADAARAVELLRASRPDVVLLDMKLPGGSGYDVLREVRRLDPNVAVFLMTGYAKEYQALVARSLREGARLCLEKPFDPSAMLGHINGARREQAGRHLSGHTIHGH